MPIKIIHVAEGLGLEDLSNRVGQFALVIDGGSVFDNPRRFEEIRTVMDDIIVISAKEIPGLDQIHYVALSFHFDKVVKGAVIPGYMPIISRTKAGNIKRLEWKKHKILGEN